MYFLVHTNLENFSAKLVAGGLFSWHFLPLFLAFFSVCSGHFFFFNVFQSLMPRLRWTLPWVRAGLAFVFIFVEEGFPIFVDVALWSSTGQAFLTGTRNVKKTLTLVFVGAGSAALRPARDREDAAREGPRFQHQRDFPQGDYSWIAARKVPSEIR